MAARSVTPPSMPGLHSMLDWKQPGSTAQRELAMTLARATLGVASSVPRLPSAAARSTAGCGARALVSGLYSPSQAASQTNRSSVSALH